MVEVAEIVLRNGFVAVTENSKDNDDDQRIYWGILPSTNVSDAPLLSNFTSAYAVKSPETLVQAAEMGALCVSIYREALPRTSALGHMIVDEGLTANVKWMVTDSILNQTDDHSDNAIRLRTVTPEEFTTPSGQTVLLHSGLLRIARAIYEEVRRFIVLEDGNSHFDRLVLAGHSIGGSNALLILFLLEQVLGVDFIRERVMKVYTFGSPPIVTLPTSNPKHPPASQRDYCATVEWSI